VQSLKIRDLIRFNPRSGWQRKAPGANPGAGRDKVVQALEKGDSRKTQAVAIFDSFDNFLFFTPG
jgi:hypothetical protein